MSDLTFDLALPSSIADGEPFTTARLSVRVHGQTVWPKAHQSDVRLAFQLDDLLSYFVDNWKLLALQQTYPLTVSPPRPSHFRREVERRWSDERFEDAEAEDAVLCAFEDTHDMARCFAGVFDLSSLWFMRCGEVMLLDCDAGLFEIPFASALSEFDRVGNAISAHLSARTERWGRLIELWRRRENDDALNLLALTTGLQREVAERLVNRKLLAAPASLSDAANDNDELRMAARMASALPEEEIVRILTFARGLRKQTSPALDSMSEQVLAHISEYAAGRPVHEQGEIAADFIRNRTSFSTSGYFDVCSCLGKLGVELHQLYGYPEKLDALAIWGEQHGPAVLLNLSSYRARDGVNGGAARVTLAHELCHLLFDRGHALGVVDVLNSKMPQFRERRAKSFAGELLLPSSAACARWEVAGSPKMREPLLRLLEKLAEDYGVSRSVAAWKLEHGARLRDVNIRAILDIIAPNR